MSAEPYTDAELEAFSSSGAWAGELRDDVHSGRPLGDVLAERDDAGEVLAEALLATADVNLSAHQARLRFDEQGRKDIPPPAHLARNERQASFATSIEAWQRIAERDNPDIPAAIAEDQHVSDLIAKYENRHEDHAAFYAVRRDFYAAIDDGLIVP